MSVPVASPSGCWSSGGCDSAIDRRRRGNGQLFLDLLEHLGFKRLIVPESNPTLRGSVAHDQSQVALQRPTLLKRRVPRRFIRRRDHIFLFFEDLDADQIASLGWRDVNEASPADRLQRPFQAIAEAHRIVMPGFQHARRNQRSGFYDPIQPILAGNVEIVVNDINDPFPDKFLVLIRNEDSIDGLSCRGRWRRPMESRATCHQCSR